MISVGTYHTILYTCVPNMSVSASVSVSCVCVCSRVYVGVRVRGCMRVRVRRGGRGACHRVRASCLACVHS